jgi:hypothetical protein
MGGRPEGAGPPRFGEQPCRQGQAACDPFRSRVYLYSEAGNRGPGERFDFVTLGGEAVRRETVLPDRSGIPETGAERPPNMTESR